MNLSPPERDRSRASVRSLRLLLIVALCLLAVPFVLQAAAPGWWTERGVVDAGSTANDFAAVNQGQVKNLATQAMRELDDHLPGSAGGVVHQMVEGWTTPTATTNDYSPVTLGALKALAQPFYQRLIDAGYTDAFPWVSKEAQANNYAAANIGQAKNLFAFDVTPDSDHNSLPDWWERHWFGHTGLDPAQLVSWSNLTLLQAFQSGINPLDFYNGHPPTLTVSGGDAQTGAPGSFVPLPLVVTVADRAGLPLVNAPVAFVITSGGGALQKSSGSVPSTSSVQVRTDPSGLARVFFRLPDTKNSTSQIVATAGGGSPEAAASFSEFSDGGGIEHPSPFAPTNLVSQGNFDGSLDMSWENHTDELTPVEIKFRRADGTWLPVATLPPGTTSYHWSKSSSQ